MNFDIKSDTLQHAVISAVAHEGFTCSCRDGKKLQLALVDEDGHVVETGPAVAKEAWNVCIQVQHNFWIGQGHLRVLSKPALHSKDQAA